MPRDPERALLRELIRHYVREVRALSMSEVRARQPSPWVSVGHGAAGIAFALWRIARAGAHRDALELAARWYGEAARRARWREAFSSEERVPAAMIAHSLGDGPAGLPFLGALIAHDRGDRAAAARALRRFEAACAPRADRPAELLHGTAGLLVGALTLHRHTGDARARAIADRLAAELCARPLRAHDGARFAHGTPGILAALFQWSAATGAALPAHVDHALATCDAAPCLAMPAMLRPSWCNGLAGHTILWAHAYRRTQDPAHRARAIDAARRLVRAPAATGNLCCGDAGVAYALLAVDRVAPRAALVARARRHAVRATTLMNGSWPNGLLRGWPGLACLAADLLADEPIGFPLVEA